MSSKDIVLSAQKREVLGKQVKALRRDGQTPAVIHDRGKDSLHVSVPSNEFVKVFAAAGRHHAIKVDVDGKKYTTIIKEVTNAPARADILHAVFQAIKEDEKVTAEIPLRLIGDIPAEKASLLVLQNLDRVAIEALPKDLVDVIEVDATSLEDVGNKIHVSDIKIPDGISIKNDVEAVIASVEMPKDQIAEADAALEEQKAADGALAEEAEEGEETTEGASSETAEPPAEGEKPAESNPTEKSAEESKE